MCQSQHMSSLLLLERADDHVHLNLGPEKKNYVNVEKISSAISSKGRPSNFIITLILGTHAKAHQCSQESDLQYGFSNSWLTQKLQFHRSVIHQLQSLPPHQPLHFEWK